MIAAYKIGNRQSAIGNMIGEIRRRPVVVQEKLVARDAHAALLFVALACQRRLQLRLLTGRNKKRVFLRILDDLLSHHFALEAAQRALNRFALINGNYCHSFSAFPFLKPLRGDI